jgi:hypothetical protein
MIKIKNEELIRDLIGEIKDFPRYTTQLMNLANQNAQGTRPRVVGQLSELIKECPAKTYEGWRRWYLGRYPGAIENATERIHDMILKLKGALETVDRTMVKRWAEDLVLEKTFIGLRFQEAILKKVSALKKADYRIAHPEEESRGIDGFIGNTPVSIKPITYNTKNSLREDIRVKIIFYRKTKSGLEVDADQVL